MSLELHKRVKYVSFDTDTTMNDLIIAAVEMYLQANEFPDAKKQSPP